ncbi:hypothetical protein MMC25_003112 [Agyrium rufum]|nr:hypothetical protein [Agyrium rufum]
MPQERQNPIARELEQARGLYQKKDYIQALARFTNIINTYADPPLKAFDGRAAVHIKLGNHPAALQDGKRMIHLAKKDAKGYFRAGQVLELMDKKDIAASIYEYGLRQIPANDPSYQMLQGLHNKMVNECATLRAVDPLTRLPLEIVLQIFRYLKFPQHV